MTHSVDREFIEADFVVSVGQSDLRLDQALSELMPDYSRSRLQQWIKQGWVTVNESVLKAKEKVRVNDLISVQAALESQGDWEPQDIPLHPVYEDEEILVLDKQAGIVVHPAAGNPDGTLVNALLHYLPSLEAVPRAGIVHRLDKDTSGLMVVAKSLTAHVRIVEQLQARTMGREYEAVVVGLLTGGGTVDEPIARHPKNRKKMAVNAFGKHALSHYRVLARYEGHTHVRVKLETGRTHQIRVHMAHIHHPLVGDPVYGGRQKLPPGISDRLKECLRLFPRQALHAKKLTLEHPLTKEVMSWEIDLPNDMQLLLADLEQG